MSSTTADHADTESSAPSSGPGPQRTRWGVIIVLALGTLAIASEMTLAAFALPLIGTDLGVDATTTAWVLLAYSLPLAALAIPAGRWVEQADLRTVLLISMLGVGITGLLGAFAPNFALLIASRVLHGLASAVFLATSMPILTANVLPAQRGRAMSLLMTVMTLGSIVATPLGGQIAAAFGWREVFLIKLPLVVVVLFLGAVVLTGNRREGRRLPLPERSLLVDVALLGVAVTALLLVLEYAVSAPVWALVLAAVAVVAALAWVRLPATRPVLELVGRPATGMPLLALMAMAGGIGLVSFLLPYYVSDVLGASPDLLGTAMLFFVVSMSLTSPVTGFFVDRFGPVPLALLGATISVAAVALHLSLGTDGGLVDMAWRMAVFGLGFGLFNPAVMTAILADAPEGQSGTSGGLANTARTVGTLIGPAVAAMGWSLGGGGIDGFITGGLAVTVLVAVGILAILVAGRAQRRAGARRT
jgi:MFS transporter, DHA2 family, multidrug resistance protein